MIYEHLLFAHVIIGQYNTYQVIMHMSFEKKYI